MKHIVSLLAAGAVLVSCIKNVLYSTHAIWGAQGSDHVPFSNIFLLVWLWLLVCQLWSRQTRRAYWPVFLPVLLNIVSIAISTATNELRYLLPTMLMCPFLTLYVISHRDRERIEAHRGSK